MSEVEDKAWDGAIGAVIWTLGDIESTVHGMMPTASWLEVVRMRVNMLRRQPGWDMDEERLATLEADMASLKQSMVELRNAIVEATSHKDMQASVAELAKPEV